MEARGRAQLDNSTRFEGRRKGVSPRIRFVTFGFYVVGVGRQEIGRDHGPVACGRIPGSCVLAAMACFRWGFHKVDKLLFAGDSRFRIHALDVGPHGVFRYDKRFGNVSGRASAS